MSETKQITPVPTGPAERQVNVRLTQPVYQAIKAEADRERRSFTAQINLDLERHYSLDAEATA